MAERNIAAFIAAYVYLQFLVCPAHAAIALLTGRANPYRITKNFCDMLGARFVHSKNSQSLKKDAMYLCNHRSWGDFFIDQALCGGAAYLSRYMVIPACPGSSLYAWISHSVWFFNRKKGLDRSELGRYLAQQWELRPGKGLIVYPEGTRNQKKEPLKLKTGVLQMAYDYKKQVQAVITTNKELMANEKTLTITRNVTCVTSISKPVDPTAFPSFKEFCDEVTRVFEDTWKDAYGAEVDESRVYLPPFGLPTPGFEPVPIPSRAWIVRFIIVALFVLYYLRKTAA